MTEPKKYFYLLVQQLHASLTDDQRMQVEEFLKPFDDALEHYYQMVTPSEGVTDPDQLENDATTMALNIWFQVDMDELARLYEDMGLSLDEPLAILQKKYALDE